MIRHFALNSCRIFFGFEERTGILNVVNNERSGFKDRGENFLDLAKPEKRRIDGLLDRRAKRSGIGPQDIGRKQANDQKEGEKTKT